MFVLSTVWNLYLVDYILPGPVDNLRAEMLHVFILIAYLLLALLMAIAYNFYNVEYPVIKKGILFGLYISLIWMVPVNIIAHSVYLLPDFTLPIDIGWAFVEQTSGGLVMALIMEKFE